MNVRQQLLKSFGDDLRVGGWRPVQVLLVLTVWLFSEAYRLAFTEANSCLSLPRQRLLLFSVPIYYFIPLLSVKAVTVTQIQTCPVHMPQSVLHFKDVALECVAMKWIKIEFNSLLTGWQRRTLIKMGYYECEYTYADICVPTGWRCKRYGHRTGDKECPFFIKGNQKLEQFRVVSVWSAHPCLFRFEITV